jgi:hypothetical protein
MQTVAIRVNLRQAIDVEIARSTFVQNSIQDSSSVIQKNRQSIKAKQLDPNRADDQASQ